jgi:hypothetical protein
MARPRIGAMRTRRGVYDRYVAPVVRHPQTIMRGPNPRAFLCLYEDSLGSL